jgi:hypothetical protein
MWCFSTKINRFESVILFDVLDDDDDEERREEGTLKEGHGQPESITPPHTSSGHRG